VSAPCFEIVPNISEGRDTAIMDACVAAVEAAGARPIHRTSDGVHHRSVITAVGDAAAVVAAAIALAGTAQQHIDLRVHRGEHPRMGALDVLPFVPLAGATLEDAATLARQAGRAIWERWQIPSILYGAAASAPHRSNLADVRRGGFEGLAERFALVGCEPDFGDVAHASAGAIAIGARPVLVAFNVELATGDLGVARTIARMLRETGGGLRTLKALPIALSPTRVQVSFNITDFRATPLYRVTELVRSLAREHGIAVVRSELIGLAPRLAIDDTAAYYLAAGFG